MTQALPHRRPTTHPQSTFLWALFIVGFALVQLVGANPGKAQEIDAVTLSQWEETAVEAEKQLENTTANLTRLEGLRSVLSTQRTASLESQDSFKARIDRLTNQLDALGEPPVDGVEESAEVQSRRADLARQIADARTPFVAAEQAYRRADGLIQDIDARLRADFTRRLIDRQPSPLLPDSWLGALSELKSYSATLIAEITRRAQITRTKQAVPPAVLLTLLGLGLLFYLRPRLLRRLEVMATHQALPHLQIWIFSALNLVRFVVPLIAAFLLVRAIDLLNLVPLSAPNLDTALLNSALIMCATYWLASSLFSPRAPSLNVSRYENPKAAWMWRLVMLLGLIPAITILISFYAQVSGSAPITRSVLQFPVTFVGAILTYLFCSAIRPSPKEDDADEDAPTGPEPVWRLFLGILSRFGRITAVLAPIAGVIGYFDASQYLLTPTILTLGVLSICFVVFDLFQRGIDSWIDRNAAQKTGAPASRLGLLPVLVGFGIICLALPVLALIWGARISDLTELWVYLRDGIEFGNSRISVTDFLSFALVFGIGYTVTRFLQTVMRGTVLPRTRLDSGGQNAIVSGIGYIGFFLSAVLAISATGLDLSNLAIVAGALSVGVGFGLQTVVSNFVSGIILLIERPIKIGDWIEVGGQSGYVQSINVRSTEIQTFDKASVIVPNADLIAGPVLNWTHSSMSGRVIVRVGVAYGTDVRRVEAILREIAEAHPMVLRRPPPAVVFSGFGADSLDFEIRAILRDVNFMLSARSDMNFEIVRRFEEENIEIPFAQREITIKNAQDIKLPKT